MHRAAGLRVELENVFGGLPEWPKGAHCKSAGYAFDGSNPSPSTPHELGEENTKTIAGVAQLVERQPSKLNVAGSNPVSRSAASPHRGHSLWRGSAVNTSEDSD